MIYLLIALAALVLVASLWGGRLAWLDLTGRLPRSHHHHLIQDYPRSYRRPF